MVQILDRDTKSVLLKLTISEYKKLKSSNLIEESAGYEFVFDTPKKAGDLLKTF